MFGDFAYLDKQQPHCHPSLDEVNKVYIHTVSMYETKLKLRIIVDFI